MVSCKGRAGFYLSKGKKQEWKTQITEGILLKSDHKFHKAHGTVSGDER
jgi:hypothetical protein